VVRLAVRSGLTTEAQSRTTHTTVFRSSADQRCAL